MAGATANHDQLLAKKAWKIVQSVRIFVESDFLWSPSARWTTSSFPRVALRPLRLWSDDMQVQVKLYCGNMNTVHYARFQPKSTTTSIPNSARSYSRLSSGNDELFSSILEFASSGAAGRLSGRNSDHTLLAFVVGFGAVFFAGEISSSFLCWRCSSALSLSTLISSHRLRLNGSKNPPPEKSHQHRSAA